jgi:hypothetical protein
MTLAVPYQKQPDLLDTWPKPQLALHARGGTLCNGRLKPSQARPILRI